MFYKYDVVSKEQDYLMPKSFGKVFSTSVELVVSYPNQVILSQKRPPNEVLINHDREDI